MHRYAFNSDLDRIEKMVVNNYATKAYCENINDRIGDFVRREELALL